MVKGIDDAVGVLSLLDAYGPPLTECLSTVLSGVFDGFWVHCNYTFYELPQCTDVFAWVYGVEQYIRECMRERSGK